MMELSFISSPAPQEILFENHALWQSAGSVASGLIWRVRRSWLYAKGEDARCFHRSTIIGALSLSEELVITYATPTPPVFSGEHDGTCGSRHPAHYTSRLKREQLNDPERGYDDQDMRDFEEDHDVPLEVGGNPIDPRNLWPEPLQFAHSQPA
jgi:hypothetical protein